MFSSRYIELGAFKAHLRNKLGVRIGNQEPEARTTRDGRKKYYTVDITCTDNDKTVLRWIYCTTINGRTYLLRESAIERAQKDVDCMSKSWGQYYFEDRKAVLEACLELAPDKK